MTAEHDAMKLGYFCGDFDSPYKSYFPRQVRGFKELDVTVFSWGIDGDASDGIRRVQIFEQWDKPESRFNMSQKLRRLGFPIGLHHRRETAEIQKLLRNHDLDLVMLHTGFVAARVAPALKQSRLPYVIQCHGGDVREAMSAPGWGRMFAKICRKAEVVLVVANYMVDQLQSIGVPRSKMVIEPMGAPIPEQSPPSTVASSPPFVFIGRLVPCKSVETIIRAVASTPASSGVRAKIIGDGPLRSDLESLAASEGVQDRVTFVGTRPPEEVGEFLAESAALVIATVDEPGGPEASSVSVVEAMGAARPVLASRCGGLVDQVIHHETGLLFDQRDYQELGRHMLCLLKSAAQREAMGEAGRARALDKYNAESRAREVQRILKAAAAR